MKTHVQKWGNSLAVRIPKTFADEAGLMPDSPVEIILKDNQLIIVPVKSSGYTLENLLAGITDENKHAEIETNGPVGNEVW